jgi:hypothetical protein
MNAGISEEVGKAAQSTIDALKSTPIILFILIFNIAWMAMVAWGTHEDGGRWERTVEIAVKQCVPLGVQPKTE